jgi:hypothetical protein
MEPIVEEPDTQFNTPRWSPDGRSIAVERHRRGADPEIVVVDVASRGVRVAAASMGTRIVMPAWRPDGRALVVAMARGDDVFNLFEVSLRSNQMRQLTHFSGGANWPDVSQDGTALLFVGLTKNGYDVFSMPYPAGAGEEAPPAAAQSPRPSPPADVPTAVATDPASSRPLAARGYSPLETLRPTSWSPIVFWDSDQIRIGAATAGRDVLGYHAYAAGASWLIASPDGAVTPRRETPDWFVSYAYDRWRATLFAAASAETSFFAGPATDRGTPSAATRRERQAEVGILLPFVHARSSHSALLTMFRGQDDYTLVDRTLERNRTALRAAWRSATARTYGYSISPEHGVVFGGTAEFVRRGLGSSDDATTVTGDVRGYVPGFFRHHVVAVRLAGGRSTGEPTVGRTFLLGGASPDLSVTDFGSGAISLLRGFGSGSFAGSRVALVNADYRLPLARPERGAGTWPLVLHTLHAAAFVDAGHAWSAAFRGGAIKTSIGGEVSANVVAGFYFPFTATAGAAWGHDGSGTIAGGVTAYVRVGRSF